MKRFCNYHLHSHPPVQISGPPLGLGKAGYTPHQALHGMPFSSGKLTTKSGQILQTCFNKSQFNWLHTHERVMEEFEFAEFDRNNINIIN